MLNLNRTAKFMRGLRRLNLISHACYTVGDTLLWACRRPGQDRCQVSYRRLSQLAGCSPQTAQDAVRALHWFGVLAWERTRAWFNGRWVQGSNIYRFSDTSERPSYQGQESKKARRIEKSGKGGSVPRTEDEFASRDRQLAALGYEKVGGKLLPARGLRLGRSYPEPLEPVRTVEEQLAILLNGATAQKK